MRRHNTRRQWSPFDQRFEATRPAQIRELLPPPPLAADLLQLTVASDSPNRFLIDPRSVVVTPSSSRYTVLVETPSGARNVSYEGIRCSTRERRIYAVDNGNGWVKARTSTWQRITENALNRHHAVLQKDVFCPREGPVGSTELALQKIRGVACNPVDFGCGKLRR